MPKGELVPTDKFKNMVYLKEFTTPKMPAILSVGDKSSYNSMAIEWGSLGVAFKKPIFTVYVKPDRYSYEFVEKTKIFTVNIINKKIYWKFSIYGTKSGRDINKEEEAGTHIRYLYDGGITFDEAEEIYVCKIITKSYLKEENMDQSIFELYKTIQKFINHWSLMQFILEKLLDTILENNRNL